MTAAKVLGVIARLSGCAGHASDAVSANTQVKMKDAATLLKLFKFEYPSIWLRLPRYKWPEGWQNIGETVVRLENEIVRTSSCLSYVGQTV